MKVVNSFTFLKFLLRLAYVHAYKLTRTQNSGSLELQALFK